jgi:GT2 family glycosyltransferase
MDSPDCAVRDQPSQGNVRSPVQNAQPVVSVIVLNWNGAAFLPRCLDALQAQTFQDFEVLVLDNGSTDQSVDQVEARWPGFRLVRLGQNLGFAKANNRGAELACGRWLAFLNNDAFPHADWLQQLVDAAIAWPDFSFFASRLVYASDPGRLQAAGDVLHVSGFAWSRDNGLPVADIHLSAREVFSPCAAAAMYLRQAFLEVGGFNQDFTSHLEDVELGFRLRLAGKRCLYVPFAVVEHLVSASYGVESERAVYQVQRNVIWMYLADMPGRLFWKYLPAHLIANLVFLVYYSLRGRAGAAWRAKWDALLGLPSAWRWRRSVQSARKAPISDIDRVLDHGWFSPYLLGRRGRRFARLAPRPGSVEPRGR